MLVTGISLAAAIISIFLHNAIYALIVHFWGADFEEPVFFIIAVFICPLGLAVGIIGGLVIFLRGLFRRST